MTLLHTAIETAVSEEHKLLRTGEVPTSLNVIFDLAVADVSSVIAGRRARTSYSLPPPPPFPSLISHLASVDVKQHVYLEIKRREVELDSHNWSDCRAAELFRNSCFSDPVFVTLLCTAVQRESCGVIIIIIIIIIMYIYHPLINALSAHMIHINLREREREREYTSCFTLARSPPPWDFCSGDG